MYFGCHNHTEYSNITTGLDSMNKLPDLVNRAKELGMSGIAITNHDNLSEVIEINRLQKDLRKKEDDFVLAIGNEIYLIDKYVDEDSYIQTYFHFLLIAKDKIGYQALVELSSKAWYRSSILRGKRRVPTEKADIEEVMKWAKGHLFASTACLGGEFPKLVLSERLNEANEFLSWCVEQFGKENFFIELQPSDSIEQISFNKVAVSTWKDKYPFIITTDSHYQNKSDFPIFEAFLRSSQEDREVKEYYEFARMMEEEEIYSLMKNGGIKADFVEQCLNNTLEIGKQIEFYDLAQDPRIPAAPLPEIKPNGWTWIEQERYPTLGWALKEEDPQTHYCIINCLNSLWSRNIWNPQYLERLEEEFNTFKFQSEQLNDNFYKYTNTMQHFINLAWETDCAVGPSRGSASGCLICYLQDVVQCDPIQYGLPFWRFLNKVRTSPLDIDTDFQPSRRSALFEAIRKERGELGLTQVATYRTLTLKAAIGSAGRGYRSKDFPNGLDPDITTYISSLIEIKRGFVATLKQTLEGDELTGYNVNTAFIKECNTYPGLLDIIRKIEGLIVGSSTHAAAVILFDEHDKITDHCSLMRAPNGDLCTALDLHTVEEAGCYKYDFLLLSTLDIQATCFKLLQQYGEIDSNLTLKQCFRKYINPNTTDFSDDRIWQHLYNNDVLSIFQFDAASGRKGVLATKPHSLAEMTAVNGLIRLMTVDGEEDQIERFVQNKENPLRFEREMKENGVNEECRMAMHEVLDRFQGCAATQESFMTLSQRLVGFTLKEADALRKTVAKKKMAEIEKQKNLFFEKGKAKGYEENVIEYLWKVVIQPSLGYGFSENHALPYSIIGCQCILLGGILFHPIYWQAACLMQRSGALDGKSANYNKIAKAVAALSKQGVKISPIDINHSKENFSIDKEHNTIHFGLSGVKGLKDKIIDKIFENRPYESMLDFIVKTGADITSVVALIKAGAFDEFGSRTKHIQILSRFKADQKEELNGRNLAMIARKGKWPQDTPELVDAFHCFNFTQYLKLIAKEMPEAEAYQKDYYWLDDRAKDYLDKIGFEYSSDYLLKVSWKAYSDLMLAPMKQYLRDHQEEMLEAVNEDAVEEWKENYFPSDQTEAQWEIEVLGLNFQRHPMADLINLSNFEDLPTEPEIANFFRIKGREIPLYKLSMIAGIVIAKDKLHSSITLLTATGPVEVKFRKQQFASYDAQISKKIDGKRKVIEKSWFNRGVGLVVHGMRQDDLFMAKTYKNSPMKHTAYKITKILPTGKVEVQKERKSGDMEESDE